MGLRLADKWIWDFWLAQDEGRFYAIHLQAPRALGDPALRHWNSSFGCAVSADLTNWTSLGTVFEPCPAPAWDDTTLWTGSVIRHESQWYLFYTGTQRHGGAESIQRIGMATSKDLLNWQRGPANPILVADPRWYEVADEAGKVSETWRDPWVFWNDEDTQFHMFITARSNEGPEDERGVIGHATSADLTSWTIHPPLDTPRDFDQMEVPTLVHHQDKWYLFFAVSEGHHAESRLQRFGANDAHGAHYMVGDSPLGPFKGVTDEFLIERSSNALFAPRVFKRNDKLVLLAFKDIDTHGHFIGELSDPIEIEVQANGHLRLMN